MNLEIEQSPSAMIEENGGFVARLTNGFQEWFGLGPQRRRSAAAPSCLEQAFFGIREEFTPGGVKFRLFVNGRPKALKPVVQEEISRIGREALVNALRHSKATHIEAEVEYLPRRLRVIVRDNGCGIDPHRIAAHWGLVGMRERAGRIGGQLRIWSRPGAGTEVEISVPGEIVGEACA